MLKGFVCLIVGHNPDVVTMHEVDLSLVPEIHHIFTQISRCLRCGKILAKVVTKL